MISSGVALVPVKSVFGIHGVHGAHDLVATDLGDDRRGTDGRYPGITADNRTTVDLAAVKAQVWQPVAVHFNVNRLDSQPNNGSAHCKQGRLQDVQPVDFGGVRPGHGPGQRALQYLLC